MYTLVHRGALKAIHSWLVIIPLHDNDKVPFTEETLNAVLYDVKTEFPGFTLLRCSGAWNGSSSEYADENLMLVVDMPASSEQQAVRFFLAFKEQVRICLRQEKVYITRRAAGHELLTISELLSELGPGSQILSDTLAHPALEAISTSQDQIFYVSQETSDLAAGSPEIQGSDSHSRTPIVSLQSSVENAMPSVGHTNSNPSVAEDMNDWEKTGNLSEYPPET